MGISATNVFRFSIDVSMVAVDDVSVTSFQTWCSILIGCRTTVIKDDARRLVLFTTRFIVVGCFDILDDGNVAHELIARTDGFLVFRNHAPNNVYSNFRLSKEI